MNIVLLRDIGDSIVYQIKCADLLGFVSGGVRA